MNANITEWMENGMEFGSAAYEAFKEVLEQKVSEKELRQYIVAAITFHSTEAFSLIVWKHPYVSEWACDMYARMRIEEGDVKEFDEDINEDGSELFAFLVVTTLRARNLDRLRQLLKHPVVEERQKKEMNEKLREENMDFLCEYYPASTFTLHAAIEEDFDEAVKFIVEETLFANDNVNAHHETPLIVAARRGRIDVVRYLLEKGFGIRAQCGTFEQCYCEDEVDANDAIQTAEEHGHDDIVEFLRGAMNA